MQTDDVAVRVKPPGSPWRSLDADPQSPVLTANQWGPNEARLEVRRDPRVPWNDLGPFTPIEVDIAGVTVWSGRIVNTPAQDHSRTLQVSAQGWQYVLDDFPSIALYAHTRMSDWKDWRSNLLADLSLFTTGWSIDTGGTITIRNSGAAGGAPPRSGVYLDLGFEGAAKRVVITWAKNGVWAGAGQARLLYSDAADVSAGTTNTIIDLTSATNSGTYVATVDGRYLMVMVYTDTAQADNSYFKITGVQVFGDTAYESGNASIFKAENGIEAAITAGAAVLGADFSLIASTTDNIPSFPGNDWTTPREICEALNAIHNRVLRVGVDKRVTFKARPTVPMFHAGAWSDYDFDDASMNDGSELYDNVVVTGSGPAGDRIAQGSTQTVPALAATDTSRNIIIPIEAPITTPIALKIGQTFLDAHLTNPLHGTLKLAGPGAIRGRRGEHIHPSLLLLNSQEKIRLDDRIDPDTGGVGRDGIIVSVSYTHADRSVDIECDNTRQDWDALLAKYNLLAGAVAGG